MLKIINRLLIIIAIVGSFIIMFNGEMDTVSILKTIPIILTMNICFIGKKFFKVNIDDKLEFFIITFIFMAHFLGVVADFYHRFYLYDKIMHTLSGVLSAAISLYFLKDYKHRFIMAILISISIAVCWEFFEYTSSVFLDADPQNVATTGVDDTMQDMMVATLGSIIMSLYEYIHVKEKI